jgi:Dyp-type peroxidase family
VVLVLVLVVFVVVAGTRPGYSHIRDTISYLGAEGRSGRWWFAAVNYAGAALIVVFAYGVQRRLTVGLATAGFLWAVALGAVLVGSFPCTGSCLEQTNDVHGVSAKFTALMIFGFLMAAAISLLRQPKGRFAVTTFVLASVNLVFLVLLGLTDPLNWTYAGLLERLFWASAYLWVLVASAAIVAATRRRRRPAQFDPNLVQPKLLRASQKSTCAAYLTAAVLDPDRAREWLRAMPTDGKWPAATVTVAFSAAGLGRLGVHPAPGPLGADLEAFEQDMAGRSDLLGDTGMSSPQHWQEPWRSGRTDVLIWVEANDGDQLKGAVEAVHTMPGWNGLELQLPIQYARAGAHGTEPGHGPLRFRDGISQPWLPLSRRGTPNQSRAAGGTLDPFGDWRPLAVGEFVLGEVDESGDTSPVPEPQGVFRHGSFLVVRKLAQNFDGLDRLDREFRSHPAGAGAGAEFTEHMMGRLRNGEPLMTPAYGINDFTYGADPEGDHCALGAHARRANPRDALGFGTMIPDRHRIIRRGKPYSDDPAAPEGWNNGLVFVAVNARIADQFEFIQSLWLNDGAHQRVGATRDLFAGASRAGSRIVLQTGDGPVATAPEAETVRTIGGGYFFAPSRAGLQALARAGSPTAPA